MNPARRYEKLLEGVSGRLREHSLGKNGTAISELEIQAHWFSGDFGAEFTSNRGDQVKVVQFGAWNREAGPDFSQAAISINGGKPVAGSIEIDTEAQDWERHGHATNSDYESVALHVCVRDDGREFFTRTARHREIPRVKIDLGRLSAPPPNPMPLAKLGRCSAPLRDLPPETLHEILEAAARYRLGRKSARLAQVGEFHDSDEALFQGLATTLGYKNNKLPFTILAQRLPLKPLLASKEDPEPLLFGVAGFLGNADFTKYDLETRGYLRGLWDRWWKLRDGFDRLCLASTAWRLSSTRPVNHPQRRIAALAQLVRHWRKLRPLVKEADMAAIRDFLEGLRDDYWDFHYTLTSKKSLKRMALIGGERVADMLANVFYPLAIRSRPTLWKQYAKLPAPLASRRAQIAAFRLLGDSVGAKTILKSAVNQQGLLQIYEDFCMQDNSDCAQCLFPKQLAQWSEGH